MYRCLRKTVTRRMAGLKRTSSLAPVSIAVEEPPPEAPAGSAVLVLLALVGFVAFSRKTLLPSFVFLAFLRPSLLSIAPGAPCSSCPAACVLLYSGEGGTCVKGVFPWGCVNLLHRVLPLYRFICLVYFFSSVKPFSRAPSKDVGYHHLLVLTSVA